MKKTIIMARNTGNSKVQILYVFIKYFLLETQGFIVEIQDLVLSFYSGRTICFKISRENNFEISSQILCIFYQILYI